MRLYKLSQNVNNGYDTYDSCIVAAENEDEAAEIHPDGFLNNTLENDEWYTWCRIEDVKVEYIGEAKEGIERGVILASFNAG